MAEGEAPEGPGYDDHGADLSPAGDRGCARWPRRARGDHESNWLITVPLVVLAVEALVAGFLQAPAFNIEKFKEWVEPAGVAVLYDERGRAGRRGARARRAAEGERGGRSGGGGRRLRRGGPEGSACFAPELSHAEFAVVEGRRVDPARPGRHRRAAWCASRCMAGATPGCSASPSATASRAGYGFLINKYYLDFLYEQGVVAAISDRSRAP